MATPELHTFGKTGSKPVLATRKRENMYFTDIDSKFVVNGDLTVSDDGDVYIYYDGQWNLEASRTMSEFEGKLISEYNITLEQFEEMMKNNYPENMV